MCQGHAFFHLVLIGIRTCREQALFDAVPAHITKDPDMWSMCDFVDVQNNSLCRSIEDLIELNEQHVYSCVVNWNSYLFACAAV